MPKKVEEKTKVSLSDMFREYARQQLEIIKNSDPNKMLYRVFPNVQDKEKGTIEFLYKKIIVGGMIDKDIIYINKLKVSKYGNEKDIDKVLAKITETITKGDMKIVNQL